MDKVYRISLTKEEWEQVKFALEEYIDKYDLTSPTADFFEETEQMSTCSLNALEVITEKLKSI